jgi:hypothetical protein
MDDCTFTRASFARALSLLEKSFQSSEITMSTTHMSDEQTAHGQGAAAVDLKLEALIVEGALDVART